MNQLSPAVSLSELPLFAGLPPEQLTSIYQRLGRHSFRRGTSLLLAGEKSSMVYIIQGGLVRVCAGQRASDSVLLGLLGPGEIVGEIHALDQQGHSADVVAAIDCVCWGMMAETFTDCLRQYPELAFNLLRLTTKRLRNTTEKIAMLSTQDVMGRVAQQMLILADQCGVPGENGTITINLQLTQSDIAALTGSSRQRINESLSSFREQKAILCESGRYTILRPEILERRCR